jgi:hypothetical protein
MQLSAGDRDRLRLVDRIARSNPFGEERWELDRQLSGSESTDRDLLVRRSAEVVADLLGRHAHDDSARHVDYTGDDAYLMETAALFDVFHRYLAAMDQLIEQQIEDGDHSCPVPFAGELLADLRQYGFASKDAERFLGIFFQLRRGFYFISRSLAGSSRCMQQLKCRLWENLFTHNSRIYDRYLWRRMEDFSTLLLGETGTGKGTAAAAIGRSGYVPYQTRQGCFAESFTTAFVSLNLSQFPEALIESELFGHRKGAFTGAVDAHRGVFATCSPHGAIFLDEIGDVGLPVQTKLLQVLQERTYSPVGSHARERFDGRVIAATNRSLTELRRKGEFRDDFYYRLCSDEIVVPPLRQRLAEDPSELGTLLRHILVKMGGEEAIALLPQVERAIHASVGPRYAWPGNVRELEQAARRVLLTGHYQEQPAHAGVDTAGGDPFIGDVGAGTLDAKELLEGYCRRLYDSLGTYGEVARRTGLDWRTVKKYVE